MSNLMERDLSLIDIVPKFEVSMRYRQSCILLICLLAIYSLSA